jgi:hypothetical protein
MPGSGEVIDGAMQQAPQPARQVKTDWHVMVKILRQLPKTAYGSRSDRGNPQLCLRPQPVPETKGNFSDLSPT